MENNYHSTTHFWACDPGKNTSCSKKHCFVRGGSCVLTTDSRYALYRDPLGEADGWGVARKAYYKRQKLREEGVDI